jgi:RimJ/RimL family protein N-acetyltransferase
MTTIPTLTTERLILRGFREDDALALATIHADPEVIRFIRLKPEPSLAKAWDYIAGQVGHWTLRGCGKWAAVERASGRLIGRIGFLNPPYEWPGIELGWTLSRDVWGRGLATEGARAALDWGFKTLDAGEIVSAIHPDNAPSVRVAERLGERHLRNMALSGVTHHVYGISRAEWARQVSSRT